MCLCLCLQCIYMHQLIYTQVHLPSCVLLAYGELIVSEQLGSVTPQGGLFCYTFDCVCGVPLSCESVRVCVCVCVCVCVPPPSLLPSSSLLPLFLPHCAQVFAHMKMQKGKVILKLYSDDFRQTDEIFLFQLVFDPRIQQ